MKMCVFKKNLSAPFIIFALFLSGCSPLTSMTNMSNLSNRNLDASSESNALVSTHYAAGSLVSSTAQRAWAINNVVLNIGTGCKSTSAGATNIMIIFGNTTNFASATRTSGTFNVTPNDSTCVVTVASLTLNSSNGVVNANNDGSVGTATYTFTGLTSQANSAAASPVFGTAVRSNNNSTANPSYIFAAARLTSYWALGSAFSPALTIYYGENENTVSGLLTTSFPSIALSATTTGGYVIPAPTYCIATGYGRPCITNPDSSVFGFTYSSTSYVINEAINLYPTAFFGATNTIATATSPMGQAAQEYKIIGFGSNYGLTPAVAGQNMALVSGGGFYATSTATGGTLVSGGYLGASPPAGSNCGVVNSAGTFNDNSGCTYSVVDALWNNTTTVGSNNLYIRPIGVSYTYAYGSFSSATNTYISLNFSSTNSANYTLHSLYNNAIPTTVFPTLSGNNLDFLGFGKNGWNSPLCPNGHDWTTNPSNYCIIQAKSNQSSVRYLILKNTDLASGIPSYQMIVFSAGF